MRREGLAPTPAGTVIEDTGCHAFHQFRIVEQEQGDGRIADIHRVDAPVAGIFFREEEDIPLLILEQLMRGYGLAVRGSQDFRIFASSGFLGVLPNHFVPFAAATHDVFIAGTSPFEGVEDADFPLVLPVSLAALVHVFDAIDVVVTNHDEAVVSGFVYQAQVFAIGQGRGCQRVAVDDFGA